MGSSGDGEERGEEITDMTNKLGKNVGLVNKQDNRGG
ncbi:hypothetical protein F441_03624 [Phytophthora nicotianae CJ01A1]|uniref:Uncharacterized protein n=4 Tax=Phytophthora nicotianae TaxID=4792 RepID=W2QKU9_PHYN3|nr:hypothetical protein PPTG_22249 [Phytophthora nicotianae INRA-310]ETI53386.1 hypothetical protein F443_03631 [Phytophthora nicotianae P1569]ETL99800.1 hypothetical protein L917_03393 [Phytophthora nicotianae]ETP23197.1 hypothetical protein F441_03624 [Phytophthora nicotianae CJ01A1]ETM52959.1 hypothetical protein L914_03499 [Phytophthora nicotianae]ETN13777.1 hypothetical protein PPTG_22249 [Phytophthora nicotianae INRA-310]